MSDHLPSNWDRKLCVLLSIPGWATGQFPHQVLRFLGAMARAEGGSARFNPLNTTNHVRSRALGEWQTGDYNSTGVANFNTARAGIMATADTFLAGPYDELVAALRAQPESKQTAEQLVRAHRDEIGPPHGWGTDPDLMLRVLAETP